MGVKPKEDLVEIVHDECSQTGLYCHTDPVTGQNYCMKSYFNGDTDFHVPNCHWVDPDTFIPVQNGKEVVQRFICGYTEKKVKKK
jgi:hypothetical protein